MAKKKNKITVLPGDLSTGVENWVQSVNLWVIRKNGPKCNLHVKLINNECLMKIQVSLDVKRRNNKKRSMDRGFPTEIKTV